MFPRGSRFARVRDVLGPGPLEDVARAPAFLARRTVRGDEDVAGCELALVPLHLVLAHAGPDQPAGEATDGRTDRRAAERSQNRPRGDERTHAGNGERADAGETAARGAPRGHP